MCKQLAVGVDRLAADASRWSMVRWCQRGRFQRVTHPHVRQQSQKTTLQHEAHALMPRPATFLAALVAASILASGSARPAGSCASVNGYIFGNEEDLKTESAATADACCTACQVSFGGSVWSVGRTQRQPGG